MSIQVYGYELSLFLFMCIHLVGVNDLTLHFSPGAIERHHFALCFRRKQTHPCAIILCARTQNQTSAMKSKRMEDKEHKKIKADRGDTGREEVR